MDLPTDTVTYRIARTPLKNPQLIDRGMKEHLDRYLLILKSVKFCFLQIEVLQALFEWEEEMLLTWMTGGEPAAPLFVACKAGARKCLIYMLEKSDSSTIVNAVNDEGRLTFVSQLGTLTKC